MSKQPRKNRTRPLVGSGSRLGALSTLALSGSPKVPILPPGCMPVGLRQNGGLGLECRRVGEWSEVSLSLDKEEGCC